MNWDIIFKEKALFFQGAFLKIKTKSNFFLIFEFLKFVPGVIFPKKNNLDLISINSFLQIQN